MNRGQLIIEVFMILAMSIVLIVFIISVQSEDVNSSEEIIRQAQAEILAKDIARTLDFVYLQGEGAQLEMEVDLPPNFDPNRSYIGSPNGPGYIVNIHLLFPEGDVDVQERTQGKVYGVLPEWSGKSIIDLRMLKDVAVVGNPILIASPATVNVIVEPEENRTEYTKILFNGKFQASMELFIEGANHDWITPLQKYGEQVDVPLVKFPSSPRPNSDYYRGITLVPGHEVVLGMRINPPRFAEPGVYRLNIIMEGGGLNISIPLNIELIREYQWLRISPPAWPSTPWENSYPNYGIGFPIHGKFIICNEHKDNKYVEVLVDFKSDVYGLEEGSPLAEGGKCIYYPNGCLYEYNANSEIYSLFSMIPAY